MKIFDEYNVYKYMNAEDLLATYKNYIPFVDLVITSPPYWDAKNYEGNNEQTGFGQTYKEYLKSIKKIFKGVYNISKDTSSLYLIIDTIKRNDRVIRLPDDIADILEDIGWHHKDTIIWNKIKTLPWSRKGQTRNIFEYILFFSKDSKQYTYNENNITVINPKEWWKNYPERYSRNGIVPSNIWDFTIPAQGSWGSNVDDEKLNHACPFPASLCHRIMQLSSNPNDLIFDPFGGSGVTLRMAEKMGRRYFGIDINNEYINMFNHATLQYVNSEWIEIQNKELERSKLLDIYSKITTKLRCIKYTKVLLKKTIEEYSDCAGILSNYKHIENNDNGFYAELECRLLIKNESAIEQIKEYLDDITKKAPLSKYNLKVNISCELFDGNINSDILNLYKYGYKTFKASEEAINSTKLLKSQNELIIFSNVKITNKEIQKIEKAESN